MAKNVKFAADMRNEMLIGMRILLNSIKITLGPKGRNAIIDRENDIPLISNDGVSIAKEIVLKNKFENLGVKLLTEVAKKTDKDAGDGTTTSMILAGSIIDNGIFYLNKGYNPVLISQGIEIACNNIITLINDNSFKITNDENIKDIALISTENKELANLIFDAMKNNYDGHINVEYSDDNISKIEKDDFFTFEKGYIDNRILVDDETNSINLKDAYILIFNGKICNSIIINEIIKEKGLQKKPILVISPEYSENFIEEIINQRQKSNSNIVAIKSFNTSEFQSDTINDLKAYINCIKHNKDGENYYCGEANDIIVTKEKVLIKKNNIENSIINKRVVKLKKSLETVSTEYEKEFLKDRIANLLNKKTVIKIGGNSIIEKKEKKLRLEDAINSVKNACQNGFVLGGGLTYLNCYKILKNNLKDSNYEIQCGINAVLDSLIEPLLQIYKNAGLNYNDVFSEQLKKDKNIGYDFLNNKWIDYYKNGIIEPLDISTSIINNSTSIAKMFLTTDVGIVSDEETIDDFSPFDLI